MATVRDRARSGLKLRIYYYYIDSLHTILLIFWDMTRSEDTICYWDIKFDSFGISLVKVGYPWYPDPPWPPFTPPPPPCAPLEARAPLTIQEIKYLLLRYVKIFSIEVPGGIHNWHQGVVSNLNFNQSPYPAPITWTLSFGRRGWLYIKESNGNLFRE